MDRTTLTRNLKPLEKQGLIEIVPGEDRRTGAVLLTPDITAVPLTLDKPPSLAKSTHRA